MKKLNFALDCREFDDYLVDTYDDTVLDYRGIHYIFRFDNGYGASVVKMYGSVRLYGWYVGIMCYIIWRRK